MLTGYCGTLVSSAFLAGHVSQAAALRRMGAPQNLRAWAGHALGPASSPRALLERGAVPLARMLGFEHPDHRQISDDRAEAVLRTGTIRVALVVAPWGVRLDPFVRAGLALAARHAADWALLFNGTHLRLICAARAASRRFSEFDLECASQDEMSCAGLWMLCGAAALSAETASGSAAALVASSEAHGIATCQSLRAGVLEASEHVLRALAARGDTPIGVAFEQALTIVYRLLFLLFAEARAAVPLWHPVYRESYSLELLAQSALERKSAGLWSAVRAVSHLAHAGCRAGDLVVTAFNGRLFAPARTPLVERRDLDDEAARRSLVALSTRPASDGEGREPISYRDLGVEELGSVYETLLDYTPHAEQGRGRATKRAGLVVSLRPGSGVRKDTGTFYTPQPIANYLVRRTLGPLVRDASPEDILALTVLDPSMGSGALLVAACGFLADAYVESLVRAGGCLPGDIGPAELALIRRTIAERCLFGVDLNPMAVQLARLSLWLTTLAADRPLSFLDHRLVSGDSLVGAWVHSLRHSPSRTASPSRRAASVRRRRDSRSASASRREPEPLPLFPADAMAETMRFTLPVRYQLAEPNDTAEQVRQKERALADLGRGALGDWKRLADLWCAHWFADDLALPSATYASLGDSVLGGTGALPRSTVDRLLQRASAIAAERRFFHWEIEFPEVFFDREGERRADGGFDAVIGNPPWDMMRADMGDAADRARVRADAARALRFTREAGVYDAQSGGHANRYQLFLERALSLARPGGRIGLVLPGGLLCDAGSAALRQRLFAHAHVEALVSFENRRAIFPIHRSVKFVLLSATAGAEPGETSCHFGQTDPAILDTLVDDRGQPAAPPPVRIVPALLSRLSGTDLAIPDLRCAVDLAIAERAAALFPPLGSADGWAARFGRELNATEDARYFRPAGRGLPVVVGRHITPFRAHVQQATESMSVRDARTALGDAFERRRLAYRDVASATNRVTLIAAVLPANCVTTHTIYCLKSQFDLASQYFLSGLFNSLVVNFLVRQRVTTHVTTRVTEQLPIPRREQAGHWFRIVAVLARRLERRHDPESEARLHAGVARLYGFDARELDHVLATFPLVPAGDRDRIRVAFSRTEL